MIRSFSTGEINIHLAAHSEKGTRGMHYHDHTSVVFLLEGGCTEKRRYATFERKAADILFLHAGELHESTFAKYPTRYIQIDIAAQIFTDFEINEAILSDIITTTPDARFLMLKFYREVLHEDAFSADSIYMLFQQFATLSKQIRYKKNPPQWIKVIYEILNDRWNEPVSLADLSKATGVNRITISKHFPVYFGCTLGTYMRKVKVERSLYIIRKGKASLTNTAYTCNFSDQSHFSRSFREFTSLSPKQYQKL